MLLILGDACNSFTFLLDDDFSTVESYCASLVVLQERLCGRFNWVFLSHGSPETDGGVMDNILVVCNNANLIGVPRFHLDRMGKKCVL